MKIEIESDVFDIINRAKEIDDGYFFLYNSLSNQIELHNKKQENSYCISINLDEFDSRVIDKIFATSVVFMDEIIEDIDNSNTEYDKKMSEKTKDLTSYMASEIYKFANNSSKTYSSSSAFSNKWR